MIYMVGDKVRDFSYLVKPPARRRGFPVFGLIAQCGQSTDSPGRLRWGWVAP